MSETLNKRSATSPLAWLTEELDLRQLTASVSAALLLYFLTIIFVVSCAALIFTGRLADTMPVALSCFVGGDAILCGLAAVLSSYSGSIAVAQNISAVLIAVVAAAISTRMPPGSTDAQLAATVLLMVVTVSLATGLFFVLLGAFKLGALVRFMPYPVMGGFLAGTGWLLLTGGVAVMTGTGLSAAMFHHEQLLHWLPGVLLGTVLLLATTRISHPLVLPGLIVGAGALFYAAMWGTGSSLAGLSAQGWLLGPFPASTEWQFPLRPAVLSQVNWPTLLEQAPGMAAVLVVSVTALLLNITGLELVIKREINLNRELVITGAGSVAAGLVGGLAGFHAISLSSLNRTVSGGSRISGLIVSLLLALTVLVGIATLGHAPRFIFGAVLIYLGLGFLLDWVYRAWFRLSRVEYLITVLIVAVIALRGFLAGIAIGLVLTTILFVVNYSRINIVKHALTGLTYRSRVRRDRSQQDVLDREGEAVYILVLHGFIFFGTANSLFEQVRRRLTRDDLPPVRFAVLDFAHVTGLDSTGLLSFTKLFQLAQEAGVIVLLTGLHGDLHKQFLAAGIVNHAHLFPDLDRGVEWCENEILSAHQANDEVYAGLTELLAALAPACGELSRLVAYLHRVEADAGVRLVEQGDAADVVYFIESGQVSAYLESPGRDPVRLETMRGGRVVGELGFYLGTPRTATVVVDRPATVYSLSREQLARLERTDPDAAAVLHHIIACLLADRVVHLMRTVDALQR